MLNKIIYHHIFSGVQIVRGVSVGDLSNRISYQRRPGSLKYPAYPSQRKTNNQCWRGAGPSSTTLARHQASSGCICCSLKYPAFRGVIYTADCSKTAPVAMKEGDRSHYVSFRPDASDAFAGKTRQNSLGCSHITHVAEHVLH